MPFSPPIRCRNVLWLAVVCVARAQTAADFFDDTVTQDIALQVSPPDWATLQEHYLENTYFPAQFTWNGITMNIGIRSRGSGSRSPVKPNLLFKFDKYVKNQKFLGEVSIVAKANNQDPSNLREWISFKLFRKMGLPSPRESFARIFLNGEFFGLYAMVESIDEQLLKRDFGENTGFLYEWQGDEVYNFDYLGPDPASYAKYLDLKTGQSAPDLDNFVRFVQAVNLSSDADFIGAVSRFIDPKVYLTQVAVENMLAESDGVVSGTFGMNNVYLYQFAGQTRYQFLPWDKDNTFDYAGWSITNGIYENVLTRRLFAIPEYRDTYLAALSTASRLFGEVGGWADREFDREYNLIADDARRDPHKQCSIANLMQSCGELEFERAAVDIRSFIAERASSVARSVGAVPRYPTTPSLTSAKGFLTGGTTVAPGALVTISGTNLGEPANPPAGPDLPRALNGVWAAVDGIRAPILRIEPGVIQIQMPWGVRPGKSSLAVAASGGLSEPIEVQVDDVAPGIVALTHSDGTVVGDTRTARRGEPLTAYVLGMGETQQSIGIGAVTPSTPLLTTIFAPSLSAGNAECTVLFSGLTPGFVGLYQMNFLVPDDAPLGDSIPLTLALGNQLTLWTFSIR